MSKELSKNLVCVAISNGVNLWIEEERLGDLEEMMEKNKFVKIHGKPRNVSHIIGVFSALEMEEATRLKNREWKCKNGKWHEKFTKCGCPIRKGGKIFIHGLGWQDEPVLTEQSKS